MKIAYVRTGGRGSRPMRKHCVQGGGGGQKLANFCVRALKMAPKFIRPHSKFDISLKAA